MEFHEKLQIALSHRDMNQKQLAERMGVTEVSISRWMHGTRIPKVSDLKKLCKVMNVSADWLLDL